MLKRVILLAGVAAFAAPMAFAGGCNSNHFQQSMAMADAEQVQEAPHDTFVDDITLVASLACADLTGDALLSCLESDKTNNEN